MRAIVQRVYEADLSVDGKIVSEIKKGLVVYFGVKKGDTREQAEYFIRKIPALRIFDDENGKTNLSVKDVFGEILFVSQFTLYGDTSQGNRPSFINAELPDIANELYEYTYNELKKSGVPVKKGVFGADMTIRQVNDGPFTVILEK